MSGELCLVTGASGYVALHVVKALLDCGFRVRATVRSFANKRKVQPLEALNNGAKYPIEMVELDILHDNGWSEAMVGVSYVLHTASPFPGFGEKLDEELLMRAAVDGTIRVLTFAKRASVNKIVYTGSCGAVNGNGTGNVDRTYIEDDFTDLNDPTLSVYFRSKCLAELAAWDFATLHHLNLVVLTPGLVLGPILSDEVGTSVGLVRNFLLGKMNWCIPISHPCCDVRDVALAHVRALATEVESQRIIICTRSLWIHEIADILVETFSALGYPVRSKKVPLWVAIMLSRFDYEWGAQKGRLGKLYHFRNDRMREVLGIEPHSIVETIVDTARSLIERGLITKTDQYNKTFGKSIEG